MNRMKAKGTARETWVVKRLTSLGFLAQRSPNQSETRDVDLIIDGEIHVIEVKDRQRLNVHNIVAQMQQNWPDALHYVVWHRTEKKDGNVKATPSGPTIVAMAFDQWLELIDRAYPRGDCNGLSGT